MLYKTDFIVIFGKRMVSKNDFMYIFVTNIKKLNKKFRYEKVKDYFRQYVLKIIHIVYDTSIRKILYFDCEHNFLSYITCNYRNSNFKTDKCIGFVIV
jgi:hypothetical protein